MSTTQACVSVVDDDALVLKSLGRLLQSAGYTVQTFQSAEDFLVYPDGGAPGCIVIDLSMPGLNGLELQQALASRANRRPVVFISGHGSVATSVGAMKAGAVDFLTKPIDETTLLGAVRAAIEKDRAARECARRGPLSRIGSRRSRRASTTCWSSSSPAASTSRSARRSARRRRRSRSTARG